MKRDKFGNLLKSNMIYAYTAQGISMIISVIFTLLLPKILGVEGFGYWQLMIMYVNYLGIFYFGLNDGYYLKNGGTNYKDLEYPKLKSQVLLFFLIQSIISILLIVIINIIVYDIDKRFIFTLVVVYLPFFNMKGFLDQTFQAVNKVNIHAISVILDKFIMLISIILLYILNVSDYRVFSSIYIISGIISLVYISLSGRLIFSSSYMSLKETIEESKENIKTGFPLMISSLMSLLILGSSKQIIEFRWGIETFSVIALSISLMNLFLVFVNKSGMVLFPSLRVLSADKQKQWYLNVLKILNIVLPLTLLGYLPLVILIKLWLPQYSDTIYYLGLLLPIVIFETKMSVLGTTFMKVLIMQKKLLFVNTVVLIFSVTLALIFAFIFSNLVLVVIVIITSLAFRSIISEYIINAKFTVPIRFNSIYLVLISILFIVLNQILKLEFSFPIIGLVNLIYLKINYQNLKNAFKELKLINSSKVEI